MNRLRFADLPQLVSMCIVAALMATGCNEQPNTKDTSRTDGPLGADRDAQSGGNQRTWRGSIAGRKGSGRWRRFGRPRVCRSTS